MKSNLIILNVLLLCMITYKDSCMAVSPLIIHHTSYQYIRISCNTTLYPRLCYQSLVKYATKIETSPKLLAITALLITFNETRSTSNILRSMSKNRGLKRGEIEGLLECVEEVSDSIYELQNSIKELNRSRKGSGFDVEMNDVQTWVSAALTDDDTCMDDFTIRGAMKVLVRELIMKIARLTSISLAFINKYAAA